MGYRIHQLDSYFNMEGGEPLYEVLREVQLLLTTEAKEKNGAGGAIYRGKNEPIAKHYTWVNEFEAMTAKTFKEVAQAFRWHIELDDEGDVYWIEFDGEKYGGDEMVFLNTIAPYVKKDSYIEMQGEEGERWKWFFDGETCEEHYATVNYPTLEGEE